MCFVGREKEIRRIRKGLEQGKNLILMGKYGIGRTRLIKQLAQQNQDRWQFIFTDFSKTPYEVCGHLMAELWPKKKLPSRNGALNYKAMRFRISRLDIGKEQSPVLVLDNISKLSAQKLDLIRHFAPEGRFRFIAIMENFISPRDLFHLRVRLRPSLLIHISYLSRRSPREFFREVSVQRSFHWTEREIDRLADITGGYPLSMNELLVRKLASTLPIGPGKFSLRPGV